MGAYITGIYVLVLSICQFNEVKMVDSADFNIQRDSLTRLGEVSEAEISRNPHHFQRMTSAWSKRIRPARKCKDGISCDGELSQSANNPKPCLESINCENKILKQRYHRVKRSPKNDSPSTFSNNLKRMLGVMAQRTPCPAGSPSCEREKAVPTNAKISYRCNFGLQCSLERDHRRETINRRQVRVMDDTSSSSTQKQAKSKVMRSSASHQKDASSWMTKKETSSFDSILRAARKCPFGLWCLENDKSDKNKKAGKNIKGNLENHSSRGKLICAQGFGCDKSKANNDDTSTKLKDIKENQGEANCPIGLWCSTKRDLGYESSSTLKQCPPGLWCKRNGIMIREDTLTKRVNKKHDKERCPSGFQCSHKREEGYENIENLNQCPPGLWCKRDEIKREDHPKESKIDNRLCPAGLECSFKREVGYENYVSLRQCPPGLWCKKNMIVNKNDTPELSGMVEYCPNGLECTSKRLVDYENSETVGGCPPGLWCKRSVPIGDKIFKEQRNIRKNKEYCSTGPWCDLKRDVANPARHMLDGCPPAVVWCKRYTGKIQAASTEQEDDGLNNP